MQRVFQARAISVVNGINESVVNDSAGGGGMQRAQNN